MQFSHLQRPSGSDARITLAQVTEQREFNHRMGTARDTPFVTTIVPYELAARCFDKVGSWVLDDRSSPWEGPQSEQSRRLFRERIQFEATTEPERPDSLYWYRREAADGLPALILELLQPEPGKEQVRIFSEEKERPGLDSGWSELFEGSSRQVFGFVDDFLMLHSSEELRTHLRFLKRLDERSFRFWSVWRAEGKGPYETRFEARPELDSLGADKPSMVQYFRRGAHKEYHSFSLEFALLSDGGCVVLVNTEPPDSNYQAELVVANRDEAISALDDYLDRVGQNCPYEI